MSRAALSGRRILIVEDEYYIASDLRRLLATEDVDVVGPVASLRGGMALADSEPLDAAILDVNLEGEFSYEIADRLTERLVPYAFVTGYDAWSMPERYRRTPRIIKPFATVAVVDLLAGLCSQGAQR